jgi:hypothetical protein
MKTLALAILLAVLTPACGHDSSPDLVQDPDTEAVYNLNPVPGMCFCGRHSNVGGWPVAFCHSNEHQVNYLICEQCLYEFAAKDPFRTKMVADIMAKYHAEHDGHMKPVEIQ